MRHSSIMDLKIIWSPGHKIERSSTELKAMEQTAADYELEKLLEKKQKEVRGLLPVGDLQPQQMTYLRSAFPHRC